MRYEMVSESAECTRAIGAQLGELLQAGDVVALSGDLGAGKTCCVQGIARGLGLSDEFTVTSPTYTLIHEYQGRTAIYHVDVYRLTRAEELYDLGYEEYVYGAGVTLIEWADRILAFLPDDHLALHLDWQPDGGRRLRFQAAGPRAEELLRAFAVVLRSPEPGGPNSVLAAARGVGH
jgi:tRNA threonylcarbamoyladenosine biosynthesis protein TsaE